MNEEERNPLTFKIDELNLSTRSCFALKRHGVNTVWELCNMTETELKSVRNFGVKCLNEVKGKLEKYGLQLACTQKPKARNCFDGIGVGKHGRAVEALKVLDFYCESVFDAEHDGCDYCVFSPTSDGRMWCPLRNVFTSEMFLEWSNRAKALDEKKEVELEDE